MPGPFCGLVVPLLQSRRHEASPRALKTVCGKTSKLRSRFAGVGKLSEGTESVRDVPVGDTRPRRGHKHIQRASEKPSLFAGTGFRSLCVESGP